MLGVVLAGGEATRLPNKPLLPQRTGDGIMIESALDMLYRVGCSRVVVVVKQNSLIPLVLQKRMWRGIEYRVQKFAGVMGAIESAEPTLNEDMLVTFCDNWYDVSEDPIGKIDRMKPGASVRLVPCANSHQLDWYDTEKRLWSYRQEQHLARVPHLAGWYYIPRAIRGFDFDSGLKFLNHYKAEPITMDSEWHDIGTPESYERYLNAVR